MFGKKKHEDSGTSTAKVTTDNSDNTTATTTLVVEESKNTKKSKTKKTQEPKLARDSPKELHATGTFYGGIASLKLEKCDISLPRTQRIILEENGVHHEYTRIKPPY